MIIAFAISASARHVELELKNGDRISGAVLAATTESLILSNQWTAALAIPLAQIQRTNEPAPMLAADMPAPVSVRPMNPPPSAAPPKPTHLWKTQAEIGLDVIRGSSDRDIYHGKLRTDYTRPYNSESDQATRVGVDYSAEYGKTDRVLSDNKMEGGIDAEFDLNSRVFANDELRIGYDEIRKIDLRTESGPGVGYHVVKAPTVKLNTSAGINFQSQCQSDGTSESAFYLRLAQDFKWQINQKVSMDEKIDYFPLLENFEIFRTRLEINLRYKILEHLSLNLSLQDFYDTHPAADVQKNELKIRSALGIAF